MLDIQRIINKNEALVEHYNKVTTALDSTASIITGASVPFWIPLPSMLHWYYIVDVTVVVLLWCLAMIAHLTHANYKFFLNELKKIQ